jgi:hypothetical protein
MPNRYDIGSRLVPSVRFGPLLNGRRVGVDLLTLNLWLLAVVTLGAGVMAALLGGRTGRDRWLWLGGLLLIGSIAVLVIGLFVFIFGGALLAPAWLADLPVAASTLVHGLLQAFVQQLSLRTLVAGGAWFAAAIGLLIWGSTRSGRRGATRRQYRS